MFEYLYDNHYGTVRVRLSSWSNDKFEVMSREDFDMFKAIVSKYPELIHLAEIADTPD
jgi:hypothetical protein